MAVIVGLVLVAIVVSGLTALLNRGADWIARHLPPDDAA
jgi:hypothetical protein